jgi:hypothetical protein
MVRMLTFPRLRDDGEAMAEPALHPPLPDPDPDDAADATDATAPLRLEDDAPSHART